MQFDAITLFPRMFDAVTTCGITGRARDAGHYELVLWNPRDFTEDAHRTVDDRSYGGGPGMVMLAEPLRRAISAARRRQKSAGVGCSKTVYLSPQGRLLSQNALSELAAQQGLILLAGRYEGVDERVIEDEIDEEISIGDYVLSGGELAAMVVIDCLVRQIPGVLGDSRSAPQDSFVNGLLDWPHYTRPEIYRGKQAPAVLLSGNHAEITRWRLQQALGRTWMRRPELLERVALGERERKLLNEFRQAMQDKRQAGEEVS
ncbi:MAG: tRNA (guanosine(37)-N1)-methyltransferase TrmD [Burkholderiales bacterium]|nr:tRNA (guanosine(37)-N1)-methyltransferase TrmD [Burkholderiales bacterium]